MQYVLIFLLFLTSCAHHRRTAFQPMQKDEGYSVETAEGNYYSLTFKANTNTTKQDADLFAKFRAIELCHERGFQFAHILGEEDKSKKKDIQRTSTQGFPGYSYGMSPYYNRYSSIGFGFSTYNTSSWNETYLYPEILVFYQCSNFVRGPEILFRQVSAEEMRLLVKDLKGGLQAEKIPLGSPNEKILEAGDVLLKSEGQRIEKNYQLLSQFSEMKEIVSVEIMREGLKMSKKLKSIDISKSIKESQNEIVKTACAKKEIKDRKICKDYSSR